MKRSERSELLIKITIGTILKNHHIVKTVKHNNYAVYLGVFENNYY